MMVAPADHHLVDQHTESPQVDIRRVAIATEHLGRAVARPAAHLIRVLDHKETKIMERLRSWTNLDDEET